MTEKPEKIKDLQYSFSGFLWKNLDKIQESWDAGDLPGALRRAINLTNYLPVVVKKELEGDVETITLEMNNALSSDGRAADFFTSMQARNKQATRIAGYYLPRFVKKTLQILDQRGYLERGFYSPISKEDFAKFEGEDKSESNGKEEPTQ
jgi:hypothetical protein